MSLIAIKALLAALNDGIEARAVGIFDAYKGEIYACNAPRRAAFWEAFDGWNCLDVDWGDWDQTLLLQQRARVVCGCGAHALDAFIIHGRWILLLLADRSLPAVAAGVVAHARQLLGDLLPSAGSAALSRRDGGSGPDEPGTTAWWFRPRDTH